MFRYIQRILIKVFVSCNFFTKDIRFLEHKGAQKQIYNIYLKIMIKR